MRISYKNYFILIFVFLVLPFTTVKAQYEDELIYEALGLLQAGKNDDAIVSALQALDINPNSANACGICGAAYKNIQFYSEAIRYYKKAAEISPSHRTHGNLGAVYAELDYDTLAKENLLKAIEYDSDYAYPLNNLGAMLLGFERYDEAEKYLLQAIEIDREMWNSYLNLGLIYKRQKKYALSIEYLKKCIALHPESANAVKLLSLVLNEEAGNDNIPLENQSSKMTKKAKEELKKSIQVYDQLLRKNRYDAYSVLSRASSYDLLGDKKTAHKGYLQALEMFTEIVNDCPNSRSMRTKRAKTYLNLNMYDEALADYQHILKLFPNDGVTLKEVEEIEQESKQ